MRKKTSNFRSEKFAFFVFFVALALISAKSASAQKIMSNGSDYLQIVATSTLTSSTLNFIPSTSANSFSLQAIANPVVPASTISIFEYLSSTSLFKMLNGVFNFNPTTGNIGIGTTNPKEKLHISTGNILLSNSDALSTTQGIIKFSSPTYTNAYAGLAGITNGSGLDQIDLAFYTGYGTASEKMRILSNSGNVGIGTTTPAYQLDLVGDLNLNTYQIHKIGAPATGTDAVNRNYVDTLIGDSVNAAQYWKLSGSNLYSSLTAWNVGIGTTNPIAKLDVQGTALFGNQKDSWAGTDATVRINNNNSTNSWYYARTAGVAAGGFGVKSGDTNVYISNLYNSDSDFGSASKSIAIKTSGNVGIGTINPLYNLDISGSARLTNGLLNSDDYFEKVFSNAVTFANGTADQAVDVRLGNVSLWGYIEVEINSTFNNQNSAGKLTKIFAVGTSPDGVIYTNESRVSDAMGTVPDNVAIGDLSWDSTNATFRIPLSHIVSTGNNYTVKVRMFTNAGWAKAVFDHISLSSVYTLAALKRPYVYYNSRVGIGTSNPSYLFDVAGEGDFSGNQVHGISSPTVATDAANRSYVDSAVSGVVAASYWKLNGSNLYASTTSWNVGIGTTNPQYKLEVNNGSDAAPTVVFKNSNAGYGPQFVLDATGSGLGGEYRLVSRGGSNMFSIWNASSGYAFNILANGNVGIATTNPLTRLYVNGAASDPATSGTTPNGIASFVADAKYGLYSGALKSLGKGLWLQAANPSDFSKNYPIILNPNGGSVGVGILPAYTLDIKGDGNFNGSQIHNVASPTTSTDVANRAYVDSVAQNFASTSSSTISYWNANGTNVYNNNSGNVGVGTSNPGDKLTVSGGSINAAKIYDGASNDSAGIRFSGGASDVAGYNGIIFRSSATNIAAQTERMRITNTGNVGINTTAPSSKLEIKSAGDGFPMATGTVQTYGALRLSASSQIVLDMGMNNGYGAWLQTNNASSLGNSNLPILLNPIGGYVGIGTTSPIYKLDVAGGMRLTGTIYNADNSRWLDMTGNLADSIKVVGNIHTSAGSLYLPTTIGINKYGVIYKGGDRFIHDFNYGNNGSVTTVGYNTFVGVNAGNFSMGSTATQSWDSSYNTGIGNKALFSNTKGANNTAVGYQSLASSTAGYNNTAIGLQALASSTTGSGNTANGMQALFSNTTGIENVAIGIQALFNNTTGNNNIAIGNLAETLNASDNNSIVIGSVAIGAGSNTVVLGNSAITKTLLKGNVAIATTTLATTTDGFAALTVNGAIFANGIVYADNFLGPEAMSSDIRLKHDIKNLNNEDYQKVLKLRPVSFTYNKDNRSSYGFIAQEVQKLFPESIYNGGGDNQYLSIYYSSLIAPTVAAVQAQEKKIEEQDTLIRILLDRVNKLEHSAK